MIGRTRLVPAGALDSQSPVLQIISPTSSSSYFTNQSQIVLSGTTTDNVGVASITWLSSAGIASSCAGTNTWQSSPIKLYPGTNALTVSVFDAAGNVGQATLSVIYNPPDQLPPWVTIASPTSGSFFETGTTNITIGAQIGDGVSVSSVSWTNSCGGNGLCLMSGSFALAEQIPLQAGDNLITLTAHDASGKSGADAVTVHYTPSDTTPPTVHVVYPSSETQFTVTTNAVVICGTASDAGGVVTVDWTNSLGGSGQCSGTYSWVSGLVTLAEGDNLITVEAHDASGNIGTTTILMSYLPSALKGAIAVQFIPTDVITNGALWQFDQGYWHFGNEVVSGVSTGLHLLSFGQLVGYREVGSKPLVVKPNQTSVVSVVYWNNSNLLRLDAVWKTNDLKLGLQGLAGVNYRIDVSTNLVNWVQFTNLLSTNSTTSFRDTGATNYNQRFYRAVVP